MKVPGLSKLKTSTIAAGIIIAVVAIFSTPRTLLLIPALGGAVYATRLYPLRKKKRFAYKTCLWGGSISLGIFLALNLAAGWSAAGDPNSPDKRQEGDRIRCTPAPGDEFDVMAMRGKWSENYCFPGGDLPIDIESTDPTWHYKMRIGDHEYVFSKEEGDDKVSEKITQARFMGLGPQPEKIHIKISR